MSYCSDITKTRILDCAKEEFLHSGFEKAQVGDIARAANVTTGAIYRHFKNKEELFFTLIEDVYTYTLDVVMKVENKSKDKPYKTQSVEVNHGAVIEALFSETMSFVTYMYEYFDEFKLLLSCSKGSRVENFIEEIVDRYTHKNMKLLKSTADKKSSAYNIKELEVHIIMKGYITSLCECIIHAIPYDEVGRYIKNIVTFQYYGWNGLLNRREVYLE